MEQPDYTLLDIPEIIQFMFYPRADWQPPPPGATDHRFPVGEGVHLTGRLYPHSEDAPSILFFHGNGEVASDYDDIAPLYHEAGVNLFVVDYRGYGRSEGTPTVSTMVSDTHAIMDAFCGILDREGYAGRVYVMGRSLGAYCAVELAARYPSRIEGLITESGSAAISRVLSYFDLRRDPAVDELEQRHREKVRGITIPLLVIHGDQDTLVPIELGRDLYDSVSSAEKRFVTIEGAGHNDIMDIGRKRYFQAIKEFVFASR
ncbi:MAG: alpha/beta fold hydrolase [Dehalococcoidia bacterium]